MTPGDVVAIICIIIGIGLTIWKYKHPRDFDNFEDD